jgi:hypothetical protein
MREYTMRVAVLILATVLLALPVAPLVAQRQYPATATIRGENIWLRVDPAEDTGIVAYLQRGDQIRVTADAIAADGDAFYPVEVVETEVSGWVRDLAVDPRSFTSVETLPEVDVNEPAPEVVVDRPAPEDAAGRAGRGNGPRGGNGESAGRLSFEGTGVDVTESFTLEPGRYRVAGSVQPDETGNFVVNLIGPGDFEELLFNEIPDAGVIWEGETSVRITEAGEYAIQVDIAQPGRWTVQFVPM